MKSGARKKANDEENPKASLLQTSTKHHETSALRPGRNTSTSAHASKKHYDHSNYWKIVVQDYAKKVEDSTREKQGAYNKDQATRLLSLSLFRW